MNTENTIKKAKIANLRADPSDFVLSKHYTYNYL